MSHGVTPILYRSIYIYVFIYIYMYYLYDISSGLLTSQPVVETLRQASTSFCERRMMAVGSTGISDTRRPRCVRHPTPPKKMATNGWQIYGKYMANIW